MRPSPTQNLEFSGCDVRCVCKSLFMHIMRTNIDIDDATLEAAMRAGPFKTKKDAVEAGLKLLARQAAYREILKWEGKLHWDGDAEAGMVDVQTSDLPARVEAPWSVQAPAAQPYAAKRLVGKTTAAQPAAKRASHGRR